MKNFQGKNGQHFHGQKYTISIPGLPVFVQKYRISHILFPPILRSPIKKIVKNIFNETFQREREKKI